MLTATGGVLYSWSPTAGLSNANISSPIATPTVTTTYTVTVTNIYGCFDVDSTTVTVNPLPVISSLTANADTCSSGNAIAIVIPSSGTTPYVYSWNTFPVQIDSIANSLSGGNTYTVLITDANGCTVSQSVPVTDLPGPAISASGTSATCSAANGTATVSVTGGNGAFTYLWNNGATTTNISLLIANNYTVTVTDDFNCTATDNVTLIDLAGPTATIVNTNPTCEQTNGSLNLIVYGGNAPFNYLWSNGITTQDQSGLAPGNYNVTVTDANGCSFALIDSIQNQASPSLSGVITNATCQLSNGAIDLTITSGTAPFIINWNSGAYSTEDLTSINSGAYTVTVTDSNNCSATASFVITDTPVPAISFTIVSSTCGSSNGSIDLTVTGGITPYTYIWWNGATTEDLDSLPAGSYGITILGANGCTIDTIINLNDITAPALTLIPTDNTCGLINTSIN